MLPRKITHPVINFKTAVLVEMSGASASETISGVRNRVALDGEREKKHFMHKF